MPTPSPGPDIKPGRADVEEIERAQLSLARGAQDAEIPECIRKMTAEEVEALRRRVVRKMDWRLMPMLAIMLLLNILDRNNYTNARLGGLEVDLNLSDTQYNTALMIMYLGYLLFQLPSNVILSKFPRPGVYLSTTMIIWGCVSSCMAAAKTYGAILTLRFILGIVEAPFFAGALLLLTSWYARNELPPRIAILYTGNTISNCFGGLIAAGVIGGMEGAAGIRAWRWLFILEGSFTILIAIAAIWVLPNYPKKAEWLTREEQEYVVWRLAAESAGVADDDEDQSVWKGALQAIVDPKVYLLILMQLSLLVGMSYTYFFPSIVSTLGYNNVITLLLTSPPYALAFMTSIFNSMHSAATNERAFHIAIPLTVSLIGNLLAPNLSTTAGRYASMFLMTIGVYSAFNVSLAWVSSTIPRPKAKRAAALAMVNALASATHLFTSYLFPDEDRPRYVTGGATLAAFCALCAITALVLRVWLRAENRRLEREGETNWRYTL